MLDKKAAQAVLITPRKEIFKKIPHDSLQNMIRH
jgi:hypothetical protein